MRMIVIKSMLNKLRQGVGIAGLVLLPFYLTASINSLFNQISYQEVVEMTIEGDFSTLTENIRSGEAQKMILSFTDASGALQTWNTKVTLRGHFRRMNCDAMPPLKLNFKKKELKEAGLAKFDDMKLVTQCMDVPKSKDWVLKEYLAYKLYNELTTESYRVQLLKITYKDTGSDTTIKQWGFLIEDSAEMRNRIAAEKNATNRGVSLDSLHQEAFYKMAVFQYMIGNNDWDFLNGRNVKVVKRKEEYIIIPYDFDFSGLVDADYAIPNPNYNLVSIKERNYMGQEEDLLYLEETLAYFESKKEVLFQTIKKFKKLSWKNRQEIQEYVNSFFKDIDKIAYRPKKSLTPVRLVRNTID